MRNEWLHNINKRHIEEAISRYNQTEERSGYGTSTGYLLIHQGEAYPPKAILGIAARIANDLDRNPTKVDGFVSNPKNREYLTGLGFKIISKKDYEENRNQKSKFDKLMKEKYHRLRQKIEIKAYRLERDPQFRNLIIETYGSQCAACEIRHKELLDAAHILPVKDDSSIDNASNGLPLCATHHRAFDSGLLILDPHNLEWQAAPSTSLDQLKVSYNCIEHLQSKPDPMFVALRNREIKK